MNVLIGTNTLVEGSGIDRVVVLQTQELQAQGHQVRVVCFEASSDLMNGVDTLVLPKTRSIQLERIRRIYPFLRPSTRHSLVSQLEWCDTFYAEQYPWSVVGVWAKRSGKQFIQMNHGVADPKTFHAWHHQIYVRLINWLALRTGSQAHEAWSVSSELAQDWQRLTGQKSRVYRPEPTWVKAIPRRTPQQARQELFEQQPFFLFVGRISPHKGIHELLEAFEFIQKTHPQVKLKIVGKVADQTYADHLKILNSPGVEWLGVVSDQELGVLYQGCVAYVTAAAWEGWNLPVAEALHFERPVVCYDLPVHSEFKNSLMHLVPVHDTKTFAQICQNMLD